jgi:hypothetical protein
VTARAEPLLANVEKLKIYRFYCRSVKALAAPDFTVPGGYAAWNRGADFVQLLAPEQ